MREVKFLLILNLTPAFLGCMLFEKMSHSQPVVVVVSCRAASLCCVLHASVWHGGPCNRPGDRGQDFDWHLLWRTAHIVRYVLPFYFLQGLVFAFFFFFLFLFLHHLYVSFCKMFLCSNKVAPGFQLRVELYSTCVVEDFAPGPPGPRRARRLGGSLGCTSGKKIRAAFESATIFRYKWSGEEAETGAVPAPSSPHLASVWGTWLSLEKHTRFQRNI